MIRKTSETATRPTFVNVGPGRCATSWLHESLMAHPEITMAQVKETEFFNSNYQMGVEWYEKQFPQEGNRVAGEISNCYYVDPGVANRIKAYNPDMRLIINVRDPYALMQSFHGFGLRRGLEIGKLEDSLDVPIGKLMGSGYSFRERAGKLNPGDIVPLVDSVLMSRHIQPFFDAFPEESIYLFVFERLKENSDEVLRELYEFLGVDASFEPPVVDQVVNASITPKSKLVARMATNFSFVLRSMGAYGVLSKLHQSRLIKRVFYNDTKQSKIPNVNPREVLDPETRLKLDAEILAMIDLFPALENHWSHLVPVQ